VYKQTNGWVYQGGDPTYEAIPNLDNWADVVHAYDSIKPVVSKNHKKEENLRPIGQRRRKWEHITRQEDIGGVTGISYRVEDGNGGTALMWEKKGEDTYLTIFRAGARYQHMSTARYKFLANVLPHGLDLVQARSGTNRYIRTYYRDVRDLDPNWEKDYYLPENVGQGQYKEVEGTLLRFKHTNIGWKLDSSEWVPPKNQTLVNKGEKRQYKEHYESFYKWAVALTPIQPRVDSIRSGAWAREEYLDQCRYREQIKDRLEEYMQERYAGTTKMITRNQGDYVGIPKEIMLEVLADEDHPMRIVALTDFLMQGAGQYYMIEKRDEKEFRKGFNTWLNHVCFHDNKTTPQYMITKRDK
jgi:hypothetical protein